MDKSFAEFEVMRRIGFMERDLPASWSGAATWADMTQQAARLIVDLGGNLSPPQLAGLMAMGAMAHRQHKIERKAEEKANV